MNTIFQKRTALWITILTIIFALSVPSAAQAYDKGRGKDRSKKARKFNNGHDARDGRRDGRGPRRDRDDRDDDDDDDFRNDGRNRRRDNDRDNDGVNDRTEIRRQALGIGYQEGLRAGQDDRASGRSYDFNSHNTYRDATAGYRDSYGDINFYRNNFRQGYRQGYDEGYRNRSSNGRSGRAGRVLGDIFGNP